MEKTRYPGVHRRSDGRYRIRVKALDPRTGTTKVIKRVVEASSAAHAAAMREEARKVIADGCNEVARTHLADAAISWLRGKLPSLKASTRNHYAQVLDKHILPELGHYYLDALTPDDIIRWRDGQTGAPPTINSRMRVLRTLLADVTHQHGLRNPAARVDSIRVSKLRKRKGLTAAELAVFLETARELEPSWFPVIYTLALTGARFSEVTALHWDHIDFDGRVIHLVQAQWHQVVDDTKTGAVLELPLLPELAEELREHRRRQVARQDPGLERGIVFPAPRSGHYLYSSVLRKPLDRIQDAITEKRRREDPNAQPFPRVAVHGFRHTYNNLCRKVAAAEVVRSLTGHVTGEMTEHYSHIDHDEKRQAAEGVLRLVRASQK